MWVKMDLKEIVWNVMNWTVLLPGGLQESSCHQQRKEPSVCPKRVTFLDRLKNYRLPAP